MLNSFLCFSLEKGLLIMGYICSVLSSISALGFLLLLAHSSEIAEDIYETNPGCSDCGTLAVEGISIMFMISVLSVIAHIFLIVGVKQENPRLVMVYIIKSGITVSVLCLGVIFGIFLMFYNPGQTGYSPGYTISTHSLVYLFIVGYFFWAGVSYRRQVLEKRAKSAFVIEIEAAAIYGPEMKQKC